MRLNFQFLFFTLMLFLLWEIVPELLATPKYIFPSFTDVLSTFNHKPQLLYKHTLTTLSEASLGFLLGSLFGILIGLLSAASVNFRKAVFPYIIASNAIPIVAVSPLIILWFGHEYVSKVVVSSFLCFFPVSVNFFKGLTTYPPEYKELFSVYNASPKDWYLKFLLPNSVPFLFTGLKLSATFAVIGAVVAEFIGSDSGLGYTMLRSTYNLDTPELFKYMFVSCLLGLAMYGLVSIIEKLYCIRIGKNI